MKIVPLVLGTTLGFGLMLLLGNKSKATSAAPTVPGGVVTLDEIVIDGDLHPVAKPAVVYRIGDRVRVLHLGRIGTILSFPRAIDPRYPPVEVQIPNFPAQVFAAQDIQHA